MSGPRVFPAEQKVWIVLSILAGEIAIAEAARWFKVFEQSVGTWKRQFLEGGRAELESRAAGIPNREAQLEAKIEATLGGAAAELRVWKKTAQRPAPSRISR